MNQIISPVFNFAYKHNISLSVNDGDDCNVIVFNLSKDQLTVFVSTEVRFLPMHQMKLIM